MRSVYFMFYYLGYKNRFYILISFLLCFFLFSNSVFASTQTIIYFPTIEKNLETGDTRVYYGAGNASAVRNTRNGVSSVTYVHPDYLNETVLVTRGDKTKESSTIYYPYGDETTDLNLTSTDKFYTGQRKDTSSDLYFYNARYYNPKISHFISADKAQGPNRYAYVGNNPIMKNDPSGNMAPPDMEKEAWMYQNPWEIDPVAWELTGGNWNLWHSGLPTWMKFLGEADFWLGHSFSRAAEAFNSPILNFNSGASIEDRAKMVAKAYLNTFIFAAQVAPIVQGGVGVAGKGIGAIDQAMTSSLDDALNFDMRFVSGSGIDYERFPIVGARDEVIPWNVGLMKGCTNCNVEGRIGMLTDSNFIKAEGDMGVVRRSNYVIAQGDIAYVKDSSNVIAGKGLFLSKNSTEVYTIGDAGIYVNSSGIVGGNLGMAENSYVEIYGGFGYAKRCNVFYPRQ